MLLRKRPALALLPVPSLQGLPAGRLYLVSHLAVLGDYIVIHGLSLLVDAFHTLSPLVSVLYYVVVGIRQSPVVVGIRFRFCPCGCVGIACEIVTAIKAHSAVIPVEIHRLAHPRPRPWRDGFVP